MSHATRSRASALASDDYVGRITRVLSDNGHPRPDFWVDSYGGLPPEIHTHPDHDLRRFYINRHLQSIIAVESLQRTDPRFSGDAITARYGLISKAECPMETWLKVMAETTLPFLCRYEIGFPR